MEIQEIYKQYVGELGRYQIFVFSMAFIIRIPLSMMVMDVVFFAATPIHWCKIPSYNGSSNLSLHDLKQKFIPVNEETKEFDSCKIYKLKNSSMITRLDELGSNTKMLYNEELSNETRQCNQWEYDTWTTVKSSLVSKYNMVCDRGWMKSMISSMYVVGWVIGTEIGCYISDRVGRRRVLLVSVFGAVTSQLSLPFINNYVTFVVMRSLMAAFSNCCGATLFTICTESIGTKYRTTLLQLYMIAWAVSYASLAGIAYLLREAFQLQLFVAVFSVITLVPAWMMPETIQWYIAKGKRKEAQDRLKEIAHWNKRNIPEDIEITLPEKSDSTETNLLDFVRNKNILRIAIIISFTWFINGLVYYAISWNAADLHNNLYLNVFLAGLVEIPAYLLNIPMLQKLGRRWSIVLATCTAGLAYMLALPLPRLGSIILVLVAKFFISISFTIIYQYSAELYPTVIRSTGVAIGILAARIGTIVSPYLPLLGKVTPDIICGALCLVGAVSLLFLPETMNMPLWSSVPDAERHYNLKLRSIVSCPLCESEKDQTKLTKDKDNTEVLLNSEPKEAKA